MKRFYWGDEIPNFGDILNGPLLKHYGIDFKHTNKPEDGEYFAIGSIIRLAKNATILGSGVIRDSDEIDPTNTFRFVRGPQTRKRVIEQGGECPEIYGDLALLTPRFYGESPKKYRIGAVPHYWNHQPGPLNWIADKNLEFINVLDFNPLTVVRRITQCEKIIASSLHGIILAHAYGIPAVHVKYPNAAKVFGDGIKFVDYYESVGLEHRVYDLEKTAVGALKFELPTQMPDLDKIESILKEYAND